MGAQDECLATGEQGGLLEGLGHPVGEMRLVGIAKVGHHADLGLNHIRQARHFTRLGNACFNEVDIGIGVQAP